MQGLPDWGAEVAGGGWAAFDAPGRVLVLPDGLALGRDAAGAAAFHVSAFRPVVPEAGNRGYGRLDIGFRLVASRALPDGSVRTIPARTGWLRLSSEALALPDDLAGAVPLACSGTALAQLVLPLLAEGVARVERALASGALPILALADLEVAGIAARVPGRAVVDIARLRAGLAAGLTPDGLRLALEQDPAAFGVETDAVAAAADHIRATLCEAALALTDAGLVLRFAETGMATGRVTLDLSQPVIATRSLRLTLDPFAAVRDLGAPDRLITRTTTRKLAAGHHEVSLDANLPRPLVGPLTVGARLVVPPRPPIRMHEISEEVELTGETVLRSLRLAPGEPLDWAVTGFAYMPTPDGRGVTMLTGPARTGSGPAVDLGPGDFPLRFVQVAAAPALLDRAALEVELAGAGLVARARLTLMQPEVTLALPPGEALVRAVAVSPAGQRIALAARAPGDWRIEIADLDGYGPRVMDVTLRFPPDGALRAIDVLAEDADAADTQTFAFTPAAPTRRVRWLCRDPFRAGLRWRWHSTAAAPFSAPVSGARLDIDAQQGAVA